MYVKLSIIIFPFKSSFNLSKNIEQMLYLISFPSFFDFFLFYLFMNYYLPIFLFIYLFI